METLNELLSDICNTMKLLSKNKITIDEARVRGELYRQFNNSLKTDLDIKKFIYKIRNENPDDYQLDTLKFTEKKELKIDK